ncbi:MAG: N-acetylmuramoyl-L-alanine amidase [Verrucomicrobiota bacterium]|nr:N-acetylmuramoyl-L-alanine amidase [Verrucomicrobiota bacterium]
MIASLVFWQLRPGGSRSPRVRGAATKRLEPIQRVVIDAGHGGNDSGAIHGGVSEKDLTLDVAQRLERLLQAQGLKTTLTRATDATMSLSNRAKIANREDDCVFVSIHFDEGSGAAAAGVQTFFATRQVARTSMLASWLPFLQPAATSGHSVESQSLAGFVQGALVARTQAIDRGTRAEQFYVVANVRHPAILVEGGFLSNEAEMAKLTTPDYRQQLAAAIGDGIMRYRALVNAPPATSQGTE